jgi:methionyl aminopeptidase
MSWERHIHVKNAAELEAMREAGRINAKVLQAVRQRIQPGVSTAELNDVAEEVLHSHGCSSPFKNYGRPPFPASITVSINEELVHGIPTRKRRLRDGDIVSVDCGTILDGFIGDSAFTTGVGVITPQAMDTA